MKRKIVATLLCAAMTLGLLAGCGGSGDTAASNGEAAPAQEGETQEAAGEEAPADTKAADTGDMVTVSLYIPTLAPYTDEAIMEVQDAVNAHLAENYGIQTKLVYIEIGNFDQSINLAMTTDELDVTCYFPENTPLATYVNNGQLLDITDYFKIGRASCRERV